MKSSNTLPDEDIMSKIETVEGTLFPNLLDSELNFTFLFGLTLNRKNTLRDQPTEISPYKSQDLFQFR